MNISHHLVVVAVGAGSLARPAPDASEDAGADVAALAEREAGKGDAGTGAGLRSMTFARANAVGPLSLSLRW